MPIYLTYKSVLCSCFKREHDMVLENSETLGKPNVFIMTHAFIYKYHIPYYLNFK